MAGFDEVVMGANEVVHQASSNGPSSSESGNEVLNGSIHGDSRQTVLIVQMNLSLMGVCTKI